ncbi:MAG: hypothetical protein QOF21_1609, partial [Actinomycetota bacterium]
MAVAEGSRPPRGSFPVNQRVLRGYGPLAVLAALLVIMALLVPSKPQKIVQAAASNDDDSSFTTDTTPGDASGTTVPGQVAVSGGGQKSASGKTITPPTACTGQKDQVNGDPYSPPCIAHSGSNGGVTSKGVNEKEIHVSYRSL